MFLIPKVLATHNLVLSDYLRQSFMHTKAQCQLVFKSVPPQDWAELEPEIKLKYKPEYTEIELSFSHKNYVSWADSDSYASKKTDFTRGDMVCLRMNLYNNGCLIVDTIGVQPIHEGRGLCKSVFKSLQQLKAISSIKHVLLVGHFGEIPVFPHLKAMVILSTYSDGGWDDHCIERNRLKTEKNPDISGLLRNSEALTKQTLEGYETDAKEKYTEDIDAVTLHYLPELA